MKNGIKIAGGIFAIIFAVIMLGVVVVKGGSTVQEIDGKDGAKYEIALDIPTGIVDLVKECKLKEVGDHCEVAITVKAKLLKKPDVVAEDPIKGNVEVIQDGKVLETKEVSPDIKEVKPIKDLEVPINIPDIKPEETKEVPVEDPAKV